jgi:uncharacterized membrane protein
MPQLKTFSKIDRIAWLFLITGLVGFLASFILTIDTIKVLQNPHYVPACNINPIISCGSVMKTAQSSVFGFANSLIGVAGFAMLIAIGVAIAAGAKFKRWFWLGLQVCLLLGLLFVHWLIYESVYRIGSLCPYCMAVWLATIPACWYLLIYNLKQKNLKLSDKLSAFLIKHHTDILAVWFLLIIGLILKRFWYYFGNL